MFKIKVKNFLGALLFLGSFNSYSQDMLEYASQFSTATLGGSARFQGFAGAGVALGADLSMGQLNPAGIGAYRNSDVNVSIGIGFTGTKSNYFGEENKDSRGYMYFPNFGVAFSSAKDDLEEGDFRGGTFAITYNKINDFQSQIFYSGNNDQSFINQAFTGILQNSGLTDLDLDVPVSELYSLEELIFQTLFVEYDYLNRDAFGNEFGFYNPVDSILQDDGTYEYYNYPKVAYQEHTITTRGAQNQFDFAYGVNFSDQFYFGAAVGIVAVRHILTKDFYEILDSSPSLIETTFSETIKTTGTGFNFKVGVIGRPTEKLRVGLSLQTPTAYFLKQNYQYTLSGFFNNGYFIPGSQYYPGFEENSTVPLDFKFRLTTPAIVRGGLAWFFGKKGFVTGDIEYVPYQMTSLRDPDDRDYYRYENRIIKNEYSGALNYRLGAEIRDGLFRYRAGYAHYANPLDFLDNGNRGQNVYTLGFGVKWPIVYLDMALTHARSKSINSPYYNPVGDSPIASLDNRKTGFVFTLGSKF